MVGNSYDLKEVFLKFIMDGPAIGTNDNVATRQVSQGPLLVLATLDLGFCFGIGISYHEARRLCANSPEAGPD
jgi:hypothetical protein